MARLHVIFYDSTLCQVAHFLKVGVMQVVLAMIEAERTNPDLILDDPIHALMAWSHDPSLQTRARLTSGANVTAVELQLLIFEEVSRFVEEGGCEGIVPDVDQILALWQDTLLKLEAGNLQALALRLDWVLKLSILERAIQQRPGLDWSSPEIKHLDHLFSSLDPEEGLYWIYERRGGVERIVQDEAIQRFVSNPPEDTRAWTRAMLLRAADPDLVEDVDWDRIRFESAGPRSFSDFLVVHLESPIRFTRKETERIFGRGTTLQHLLQAFSARQEPRPEKDAKHLSFNLTPASFRWAIPKGWEYN